MTSILGPTGLPFADLSGDRNFLTRTKGDVTLALQWIDVNARNPEFETEGPVPCMVFHHAHRQMEVGSYVIPQVMAYKYVSSSGHPTIYLHNAVALIQLELGFAPNDTSARNRIIDLMVENLVELFNMPTEQPTALEMKRKRQGIEASIKINGKTIHQEIL